MRRRPFETTLDRAADPRFRECVRTARRLGGAGRWRCALVPLKLNVAPLPGISMLRVSMAIVLDSRQGTHHSPHYRSGATSAADPFDRIQSEA